MNDYYVCWLLANKCNLACKFCWALWDDKNLSQSSTKDAQKVLDRMLEVGIKTVNFTGGEPLLRSDIIELVAYARKIGIKTLLTTNTLLASPPLLDALSEHLDWLCVSLDGSNMEFNKEMRESSIVFDKVISVLKHPAKYKIKVNTVVSKKNIENVVAIGELLSIHKVDKWKIFPFTEREYNIKFAEMFAISSEQFHGVCDDVLQRFPLLPIEVFCNSQRQHGVILVNSVGGIFTVDEKNMYVEVGNVFEGSIVSLLGQSVLEPLNSTIKIQSYGNAFAPATDSLG